MNLGRPGIIQVAFYEWHPIRDTLSNIGENIINAINNLLADTGEWAVSVLSSGARMYHRFLSSAYKLITKDIHDATFGDFWKVVNSVASIFVAVSSVLLILMFLYTLVNTSLESRQEVNVHTLIKDFIKLIVCNFAITKAVDIVAGIFTFGTRLASASIGRVSGVKITDPDRTISRTIQKGLEYGVHGFPGLLVLVIAFIGAVVMVACALVIVLEIYKRFFKIFVLIPFASISFSTAVMDEGNGREIFRGYLKSIIAVSFEAVVIVLCMAFCASITVGVSGRIEDTENMVVVDEQASSTFMESLFNVGEMDTAYKEIDINSEDELKSFMSYAGIMETKGNINVNALPAEYAKFQSLGKFTWHTYIYPNGVKYVGDGEGKTQVSGNTAWDKISAQFQNYMSNYEVVYPMKVVTGKDISLGQALILILEAVFPMVLTAAAIKEAPVYASKIVGLG